ncbi:hypothetical protein FNV43_RR16772 [Rhamnella rubrinervis]|uniref:Uncharacterized protein n=1 Tax=Rhamnella rubrinervis TaxID=2594499 RepID=A0A8K0GZF4_9ROSA|nr:hypothetical protein FNV43_RR16772 [Rhamnella rubrinervis]
MNSTHNVVLESIGNRSSKETKSISNPTHVRSKGCRKRLKSSKEIQISKSRLCRGCGLRGQSHDKRNCPKLHSGSTMDGLNSDSESPNDEDLTSQADRVITWEGNELDELMVNLEEQESGDLEERVERKACFGFLLVFGLNYAL